MNFTTVGSKIFQALEIIHVKKSKFYSAYNKLEKTKPPIKSEKIASIIASARKIWLPTVFIQNVYLFVCDTNFVAELMQKLIGRVA